MTDYNPLIPAGTDNLSVSQGQIQNNFQQLDNIFDLDHYTWDNVTEANRGLHRQITFPLTQSADPVLVGTAGEVYTKTIDSIAELFFANSSAANAVWYSGSGSGLVDGNFSMPAGFYTFPNGFQIVWGSASGTTSPQTISYGQPFTTWSIPIVMMSNAGRTYGLNSIPTDNLTGFTIGVSGGLAGQTVYYIAIGF